MGSFLNSFGNVYVLVGIDYVSIWVEAIPLEPMKLRGSLAS